ncbi:MAG: hypothetical protein KF864_04000 [Phycisphaeraceae bacterium]|nr:hypothetical protein [Phycisphaeraceae bacterium]
MTTPARVRSWRCLLAGGALAAPLIHAASASTPAFVPGVAAIRAPGGDTSPPEGVGATDALVDGAPAIAPPEHMAEARFTPYAWLTGFNGDVNARGLAFGLDLSFGDILDTSDTVVGLMGAIDLVIGRAVFEFSGAYASAEMSETRSRAFGRGGITADATIETGLANTWLEFLAGYRMVERGGGGGGDGGGERRFILDTFAGIRHTQIELDLSVVVDTTLTLPGGEVLTAQNRTDLTRDQDWFEPFIGARAAMQLHEGWAISARGDIGGLGFNGAQFAWQLIGAVGYEWAFDWGSAGLLAGYRALQQDFESGGFEWDVLTHGPIMGFTVRLDF